MKDNQEESPVLDELPENVVLRAATESDTNFIFSSWLKSYKRTANAIPYRIYYKLFQSILERLFHRPPTQTTVACFRTRPEQIFGYIVYETSGEETYVHYVYVKEAFRGMSIGKVLLATATSGKPFTYTFRPRKHGWLVSAGGQFNDSFIRSDLPE